MRAFLPAALVLGVLPVVPAHAAAGETCQGKPATIVASEGATDGTDGDDVIVVPGTGENARSGYIFVGGGEGDDLICVSGELPDGNADTCINGDGGTDTLVYRGSAGNERLCLYEVEVLDVDMGRGVDRVDVDGLRPEDGGSGLIDGGPERNPRNRLSVETREDTGRVLADLGDEKLLIDGIRYEVTGMRRVFAIAQRVALDGDTLANELVAQACSVRLRGGRGDDLLRARRRGTNSYEGCREYTMKLLGQQGNDRLHGSVEDDVLMGGPGRDAAYGRVGQDTCVAEFESDCER